MNSQKKYIPRLKEKYLNEVIPQMKEKFGYTNTLAIPKLLKISINMGVGEALQDTKYIDKAKQELATITGQMPKVTRARKAISNFKLKQGAAIGCAVTLRKDRMYEFLDKFISIAAPRIRDFRGFTLRGFDGNGNYNFGLSEQTIFIELETDRLERTQGLNITICTSAQTDEEAKALLIFLGFPFRK